MIRILKFFINSISVAAVMLLAAACQPAAVSEFEDIPVVEGFLWKDVPVNVKISKLIPFRDDVSYSGEDVAKLDVTVSDVTSGLDYALVFRDSVYVGEDFLPEAGHSYRLQFAYNGAEVTAETQIAETPRNVVLSKSILTVQTFTGGGFPGGGFPGGGFPAGGRTADSITVSWSNPNREYYYVLIENVEENPVSINNGFGNMNASRIIRTELAQESSVTLQSMQFSCLGRHTVRVCRLQPEYVAMLQHNSETLTEVFANVVGGFGIFTGIGDYSAEIVVEQSEE